jgi:hypothetical protein
VDDAVRVRVGERARDLAEDPYAFAHRHLTVTREPDAERLALHERHREVRHALDLAGGEQRDDVRVLETRGDGNLALEAFGRDAGGKLRRQHLHNDGPTERGFRRGEDSRHTPARELALEGVRAGKRRLQPFA